MGARLHEDINGAAAPLLHLFMQVHEACCSSATCVPGQASAKLNMGIAAERICARSLMTRRLCEKKRRKR